ncbi:MAG: hypothetical protein AAFR75_05880 [Pseudomonadota bacterium]
MLALDFIYFARFGVYISNTTEDLEKDTWRHQMTDPFTKIRGKISNEQLLEKIFDGQVLIVSGLQPVEDVVGIARSIISGVFESREGDVPDCNLPAAELKARNFELRRRFDESQTARAAFEAAIEQAGLDTTNTYRDRLILRVSAPVETLRRDPAVTLPAHRDTWGSGFLGQINWWLPVFPLLPANTAILYPGYWKTPVANNAQGWDWRQMKHDPDYPPLPTTDKLLPTTEAVPLMLEPGQMAVFAGAHLHATRPNMSDAPRFSADTRTVDPEHERLGIGAPNVDHAALAPATPWFKKFSTGARMPKLAA